MNIKKKIQQRCFAFSELPRKQANASEQLNSFHSLRSKINYIPENLFNDMEQQIPL